MNSLFLLQTVRMHIARHFKYYVMITFAQNSASLRLNHPNHFYFSLINKFSVPERGSTLSVRGEKEGSWTQDADICQEVDEVCDDKV